MTNAQKVIEWCDKQESGKVFKLNELLQDTGINCTPCQGHFELV